MEENQTFLELELDKEASENLIEATRWGKLLAVLALIAFGLMFLLVILLWRPIAEQFLTWEDMQKGGANILMGSIIVVFIIVGAIVGIMMSFLLKGANRVRNGINNNDQILFNSGLANLKNYFAMYGVLSILGLLIGLIGLLNK